MPRFSFDLRDGDELAIDDEGLEVSAIEAVQAEAARDAVRIAIAQVTTWRSKYGTTTAQYCKSDSLSR